MCLCTWAIIFDVSLIHHLLFQLEEEAKAQYNLIISDDQIPVRAKGIDGLVDSIDHSIEKSTKAKLWKSYYTKKALS